MRILAIETSGTAGSIAAIETGQLLAQLQLDPAGRSARTLAPGLDTVMRQVGWKPADVQLVAVGIGPGSFTGLRLGVMTAKAFAYAAGSAILGVGTPHAIAARAPRNPRQIAVAIDAQRGEVYSARFTVTADDAIDVKQEGATEIIAVETWLASLTSDVLATGPALAKLAGDVPPSAVLAPREVWFPDAASIGRLAAVRAARGEVDDLWTIAPLYLRRSAAEEKWNRRAT